MLLIKSGQETKSGQVTGSWKQAELEKIVCVPHTTPAVVVPRTHGNSSLSHLILGDQSEPRSWICRR
jgi:hypothetical protein